MIATKEKNRGRGGGNKVQKLKKKKAPTSIIHFIRYWKGEVGRVKWVQKVGGGGEREGRKRDMKEKGGRKEDWK